MQYLKEFLRNLILLLLIFGVLHLFFLAVMGQVFQLYGMLFGALNIVILLAAALPHRRRRPSR
jgi:hypothetical protein